VRNACAAGFALLASVPSFAKVIAVDVDHVVHPITSEIVAHAIGQAERENATALLIRLNTPGGLLEATRMTIEKLSASPVPVITYVTPTGGRAASAGFFLLMAGDAAAMSPGTSTGAASPVLLGKEMDPVLRKKAENDAAAMLRSLASQRSRNSALAEKTVFEAKAFTEAEAVEQKLIEAVAGDERSLLEKLHGREVVRMDGRRVKLDLRDTTISDYRLTLREQMVSALTDPNLAFVLLMLGALGIYIEFSSPGLIAPGVAGGILVIVSLSALAVLPLNWGAAGLLLLAIVLFVLEAKFTSHGVLGVGGAVAMVLGAVLLIDAPPELRIQWPVALSVALPFALITVFLLSLVVRARAAKAVTGVSAMVGQTGVARTQLNPRGTVLFDGAWWDAVADSAVEAGKPVRVKAVEGLTLHVEPEADRGARDVR
jgi:membrane-bound serine protease (ClpP class)